jgi:uncharacterized protein with PIN domain/tRNA(Ser,Leu) C12 N-acetylase TAN1
VLFLLRCTERGKEPHAGKNKLRNDIADCVRAAVPGARLSFDVGRVYVEADRDITAELAQIHGVSSFSRCSVCDVDELDAHVLATAPAALAGKRSFRVKIRRSGDHPFSSSAKAAELGAKILASVPGAAVDLRSPEVELSIEIRDRACFVCTDIVPGLDARRASPAEGPPAADGGPPRFLVDAMLGTLASRLRALGFDTEWRRDTADSLLLREARAGRRFVLTQDRELAEIGGASAHFVRGKTVELQLADVIARFALTPSPDQLFTRCSLCNAVLVPIEKSRVEGRIPPGAFAAYDEFWTCRACDKIYWKGSHYDEVFEALYGRKPG